VPTTSYRLPLSENAELLVWFVTERGAVLSYSVVLVARYQDAWHTIRVYDNAHGRNEFHRHTLAAGKQAAEGFLAGDFGEAMRAARGEILAGYEKMIEAWQS
jgi:hypothetical protein